MVDIIYSWPLKVQMVRRITVDESYKRVTAVESKQENNPNTLNCCRTAWIHRDRRNLYLSLDKNLHSIVIFHSGYQRLSYEFSEDVSLKYVFRSVFVLFKDACYLLVSSFGSLVVLKALPQRWGNFSSSRGKSCGQKKFKYHFNSICTPLAFNVNACRILRMWLRSALF